jgi:hypothetical protein
MEPSECRRRMDVLGLQQATTRHGLQLRRVPVVSGKGMSAMLLLRIRTQLRERGLLILKVRRLRYSKMGFGDKMKGGEIIIGNEALKYKYF